MGADPYGACGDCVTKREEVNGIVLSALKQKARLRARASLDAVRPLIYRAGAQLARPYYAVVNPAFGREQRAVFAGISRFHALDSEKRQHYLLRRRIHMLEKGLSMRPRRETFASDYIEWTVATTRELIEIGELSPQLRRWVIDVLLDYFRATESSRDQHILRARNDFAVIQNRLDHDGGDAVPLVPASAGVLPGGYSSARLFELSLLRRSTRWYRDDRVPRAIVDRAVVTATESPTACNRTPYRFLVMDRPEDAAAVAALAGGTVGFSHQVPALIAVVGDLSAYQDERDRHLIYIDASLAVMSLLLSLTADGVSTCCINWPDIPKREKRISQVLDLDVHERVVMLVAYGYADPDGLVPASAKVSIDEVREYRKLGDDR